VTPAQRRILGAALGSVVLHAAVLSLPLGVHGGRGFMPREMASAIRATLQWLPAPEPRARVEKIAAAPAAPPPAGVERARTREAAAPPPGSVPLSVRYFKASELTQIPRPLSQPALGPVEHMLSGTGGIHMTLYIDERGDVSAIDVRSATLPGPVVAQAAAAFSQVRFSPGRIGRLPVKSQIGIDVGAAAAQRSYAN
jgi:hypothetical protein